MTDQISDTEDSIGLEVTVCSNGAVNVRREQSDRGHSVFVDGNSVVHCSCKGFKFHGHCCHEEAINRRPIVLSSAEALSTPTTLTDGGTTVEQSTEDDGTDTETCDRCPKPLSEVHEAHKATVVTTDGEELCPECAEARSGEEKGFIDATNETDSDDEPSRVEPVRSEPADFGGGEGGMDQL